MTLPESRTAQAALLLTVLSVAAIVAEVQVIIHIDDIDRARMALDAVRDWWVALPLLAGLMGVYAARNLPTSNRAPTTAELAARRHEPAP